MEPPSEHVYIAKLLTDSISSESRVREEAYARLVELESKPTYLATLIDVAYIGDQAVSKLAFVCAKNALARTRGVSAARAARSSVIDGTDESLDNLKAKLFAVFELHLNGPGRVISKDFALLFRKVSRWNYPHSWMNMHDLLVRGLEAGLSDSVSTTRTLNCVLLLHHIFKEKCSMRLVRDRNITKHLAEAWYPYVSKLWLHHWLSRWASGNVETTQVCSSFSQIDMDLSRYLDSLLIAFYTHGLSNIYQSSELLELLKLLCSKLRTHLSLMKSPVANNELLEKNTKRLLRGAAELFEKEAMVFAFVDPAVILNPAFDYLVYGYSEAVIQNCMNVLSNAFRSPVVNNERYTQQTSSMPGHQSGKRGPRKIGDDDIVIHATFEEMKLHCEMAASCSRGSSALSSLKNSSSPTKVSHHAIGGMAEQMSRQATFLFWECISSRGGFSQLLDFLRQRYLTLSADIIEEWNEEPVPMDDPPHPPAHNVISAMKLTGSTILQYVSDGIMSGDGHGDFLRLDSYLQLYTISYPGIASFHSSKHYLSLLETMKLALTGVDPGKAKLLIFRCSRVVNAWVEKVQLFEERIKREIMVYLIHCLCCQGDSETTLNLQAQHVVPFHRLYSKTVDEPFWDFLRQGTDIQRIVSSLVALANIDIPIVQHRSLELVCKMCLEFDSEENSFGTQLTDLLHIFSNRCNNLQVTASLLQTSLDFLNALDWQRCYEEDTYVNGHLRRFLFHLLFHTLVISDLPDSTSNTNRPPPRMMSACKYTELEEDALTLWVCLLRVLPFKLEAVDQQLLNNVFSIFPLLLDYLVGYDTDGDTRQIRIRYVPAIHIDIVTEYLTVIIDSSKAYLSSASGGTLCERADGLWFQNTTGSSLSFNFNLSQVQTICLESLKRPDDEVLHKSGLRLLNILIFGFGRACLARTDMSMTLHDLLLHFCVTLNEAAISPEDAPAELRRSRVSCLSRGSQSETATPWQVSKVQRHVVESISSVIPVLSRWGFDSPASFMEVVVRVLESGRFSNPEVIILSLLHASMQFNNNAYLRLGALLCCCLLTGAMASKYPGLKLFVHFQDSNLNFGGETTQLSGTSDNPHPNMYGVYIPCYLLRLVDSIVASFVTSKKDFCFSITKASLQKDGEDYAKPSSRRFHLFANVSSTYGSTDFPLSDFPAQELFYGAIKSTLQCIVMLARALGDKGIPSSIDMMLVESGRLHEKLREILASCCNAIE
ncbi:importin-11 isoform X1, putative [Babesia ovis]|uniref:Importin-11 isoform X1, putative n=1 Tax=Babesia ovis TaxID=5869 RepID=A0A9W5WV82_BABOV|nr:importin-11 isoform X1, putative [Babesia ovis]